VGYPENKGPQPGYDKLVAEALIKAFGTNYAFFSDEKPELSTARLSGFVEGATEIFNKV